MKSTVSSNGTGLRALLGLSRQQVAISEPAVVGDSDVPGASRRVLSFGLRRLGLTGAALAALIGVAWGGYRWWTVGRHIETTDDAYVGGDVTAIAPHVSGFVSEIPVADNELVHAGQVLVRLDPRDFQAALDHATATVAARATDVEGLHARYALQQSTIRQQQADVAAKAARATFTGADAERYQGLARTEVVSRQQAQQSVTLDQEARAAVSSSQAALEAARQQLKVLEAQIAVALAAEAEARSDLETARLDLSYTVIHSPIDGYVSNRAAEVGAYVKQGAHLVSIVPVTGLWVDANFKEDQLARIRPGQSVSLRADVLSGHPFHGRILSLARGTGAVFSVIPPENATGNFTKIVQRVPVRIALEPRDPYLELLRPGLSITANVDTRSK